MPPRIPNLPERRQEYFNYSTGRLAAITVGATVNTSIIIQADADFLVEKLTYYADLAGVAQTYSARIVPNVTVLITASSSGVQIMNNPVPIPSMFGEGDLPFILPSPRLLGANSQLQIQLVSFEAAVTPAITLNFHGRKLYMLERRV
jgi:hypothetical protein